MSCAHSRFGHKKEKCMEVEELRKLQKTAGTKSRIGAKNLPSRKTVGKRKV